MSKTSKKIRFGIIGCGLMGKEFASAAARWCHLTEDVPAPEIVGVCDFSDAAIKWFTDNFDSIKYVTSDYKELLNKEDIDAIYCALPHNLHGQVYSDIIRAGKHFLGEKPFGIDKAANEEILKALEENPGVIVRCASEFPFFPACQELIRWVKEGKFGKIIEVHAGFNHSSDMDLTKPINWKRTIEINGEYGCMGDLGIHTQHVPFRMGWIPKSVYAVLSNICTERPDGKGGMAPCKTWDNATLVCEAEDKNGDVFPMFLETKRMSPGSTDEWFIEVYGLEASGKFNSNDPNAFCYTNAVGKEQAWCRLNVGYKPQFPTITGSIFEFGFTDSILQMWCSFMKEVSGEKVEFGCFTPEETRLSHKLLTAALESHKEKKVVTL
ncbi:MAG: Gfo/Idh/MocA family oxidoreductase [Ruminococcaceae bacterium]|nr:Gfo/Idh/MocA family oxidoreductase [Oscillospiraceae bacterium]